MHTVNAMPARAIPVSSTGRGFTIALWTVQVLLAGLFLMSGAMKLTAPVDQLAAQMPWVTGSLGGLVRFIGVVEVLGAIGLIAPAVTRILPRLTPLAAVGLGTVMLLATITHITRGEFPMVAFTLPVAGLAAFVAWGRTAKAPVAPRG